MAYETIASGNSIEEFQNATPTVSELKAGDKGRIVVSNLPSGMAHVLFDVVGAEQTVGAYLAPAGCHVIDCHEENNIGYVEFEVTGTPVIPIIYAVCVALLALGLLGILITISMQIEKFEPKILVWQIVLVIFLVLAAIVIVTVLVARKGKMSAGKAGVSVGK